VFQSGDLVVHGATGVCRVEEITAAAPFGADRNRQYYRLAPLQQDGVIYTPVDNAKVPLRPVISREEANALIDRIPTVRAKACHAGSLQALAQHYQNKIRSGDCGDLLELTMSIYCKKQEMEQQKRRLGLVDERFFKQAEKLLFGELSAALEIPYEEVSSYIARRVEGIPQP